MSAVPVLLSPTRPLDEAAGNLPYFTRPMESAAPPVTEITSVTSLDELVESVKCSCNAGDDNPH
ncbi:hypothetical protein [Streptomyces fructofermentans]|uniref:hypothetical protein n=1 Tax=Streptomyces fructofermentans TaxID=152141 RepID=UPI0037AD0E4F